jgi:membrane-bound lytic murein transglycosylase MltF
MLSVAVMGISAGAISLSCNQEQRLAIARGRVGEPEMESTTTAPVIVDELSKPYVSNCYTVEGMPGVDEDTSGLLDPSTEQCIREYGPAIKRYAGRYDLDWRLVLAIMKQESRYSVNALSHKGAAGLMQLMPVTGEEMARKLDLEDLSHPEQNIQAGVYYFRRLYNRFGGSEDVDRLKLTLAAYNAGPSRVFDAQELAFYLHNGHGNWQAVKDALPLLSKQDSLLHRSIWGQDRPRRAGWFGNSGETLRYVDSVMNNYDTFRLALN